MSMNIAPNLILVSVGGGGCDGVQAQCQCPQREVQRVLFLGTILPLVLDTSTANYNPT